MGALAPIFIGESRHMTGFVNINKPLGMTSNDVVVKARGVLKAFLGSKKLKVGHLGTLDPLAAGVLPIAVGRATRLFDFMLDKKKRYIATFKFGETTPTLDRGSEISMSSDISLCEEQVFAAASAFVGEISQMPPQYSAKSVDGKRAYEIARGGNFAELSPKIVTIYSINSTKLENLSENEYAFDIVCSSGTYIRALARDIAEQLGTIGYMTSLTRVKSGPFDIDDSVTLEQFQSDPSRYLLPVEFALGDVPAVELSDEEAKLAENGIAIKISALDGTYKVVNGGKVIALGHAENGKLKLKVRLCE